MSDFSSTAVNIFDALADFVAPFVTLAEGLSKLLGLIA